MAMHNANNERIKRRYFVFLKEAKRQSEDSVDAVAKALARFEAATRYRDFKAFHFEQAVAFKKHLAEQNSLTTGGKLSKATLHAHSRRRGCRTSTRTACEPPWSNSGRPRAMTPSSSRHGARTWGTKVC